jgi:Sulfotransferase domain
MAMSVSYDRHDALVGAISPLPPDLPVVPVATPVAFQAPRISHSFLPMSCCPPTRPSSTGQAYFGRQLTSAHLEAKVVLTVHDPDRWYDSISATIFPLLEYLEDDGSLALAG